MATGSIVRSTAFVEYVASDPGQVGDRSTGECGRATVWPGCEALQAQLRLREAYGVADEVTSESGDTVDLFRALLSLDLMSAFFQRDFLAAFADRLDASGDWIVSAAASDHGRPARRASEPAAAHLVGSGLEGDQHHWVDRHGI